MLYSAASTIRVGESMPEAVLMPGQSLSFPLTNNLRTTSTHLNVGCKWIPSENPASRVHHPKCVPRDDKGSYRGVIHNYEVPPHAPTHYIPNHLETMDLLDHINGQLCHCYSFLESHKLQRIQNLANLTWPSFNVNCTWSFANLKK